MSAPECPDCPHGIKDHWMQGCMWCQCVKSDTQLHALGLAEGERRRDAGTERVLDASDEWRGEAYAWAESQPRGTRLTSTDVIEAVGMAPKSNAVGAVMRALGTTGILASTGEYVKSPRPKSHAAIVAVWVRT